MLDLAELKFKRNRKASRHEIDEWATSVFSNYYQSFALCVFRIFLFQFLISLIHLLGSGNRLDREVIVLLEHGSASALF